MADDSILDRAIATSPAGNITTSLRVDRIMRRIRPHLDPDDYSRLCDMLESGPDEWGHTQMSDILRTVCNEIGTLDHEYVTYKNVEQWRQKSGSCER